MTFLSIGLSGNQSCCTVVSAGDQWTLHLCPCVRIDQPRVTATSGSNTVAVRVDGVDVAYLEPEPRPSRWARLTVIDVVDDVRVVRTERLVRARDSPPLTPPTPSPQAASLAERLVTLAATPAPTATGPAVRA